MPVVSVIVPVYNPGERIEPCIESLLGQSMPGVELIFVDDGSTDDTPARLDALAAEHPSVRVEHMPNSGWPGRPRNRGLDLAAGEYVYFVDNDDWLEPDALERMHAMAIADRADIVIGKVVGHGKSSARQLFAENLHGVRFTDRPLLLLKLLTPHKLFRRELIERHGLRFPEGRRRLEDHVFVVDAYLQAERISVLADHPCYHWVFHDRAANASHQPIEEGYYDNVREVLDLVERHIEPGPLRDRVLAHWYRGKMLGRLTGPGFLARSADRRDELFGVIRDLALERWDEGVQAQLPFHLRMRSRLLRDGSLDGLLALARFEGQLSPRLELRRLDAAGDEVALRLHATVEGRDWPLAFSRSGDRMLWEPPPELRDALADADLDATRALRRSAVGLHLEALDGGLEYGLPATTLVAFGSGRGLVEPALDASSTIAPATAAAGGPLPDGSWYVQAAVDVAGFSARTEVPHGRHALVVVTSAGRIGAEERAARTPSLRRRAVRRLPWLVRGVSRARARRSRLGNGSRHPGR